MEDAIRPAIWLQTPFFGHGGDAIRGEVILAPVLLIVTIISVMSCLRS